MGEGLAAELAAAVVATGGVGAGVGWGKESFSRTPTSSVRPTYAAAGRRGVNALDGAAGGTKAATGPPGVPTSGSSPSESGKGREVGDPKGESRELPEGAEEALDAGESRLLLLPPRTPWAGDRHGKGWMGVDVGGGGGARFTQTQQHNLLTAPLQKVPLRPPPHPQTVTTTFYPRPPYTPLSELRVPQTNIHAAVAWRHRTRQKGEPRPWRSHPPYTPTPLARPCRAPSPPHPTPPHPAPS
jgi:hypothetical protein